jgi:hypothetical protein
LIVAQNSASRERIDGAKAAVIGNKQTKVDSILIKRKAVSDKFLCILESDSKKMKTKMEKDKNASMKNEIALEEARYTSAKTLLEQNLRAIKAVGKGTIGLHEKKALNHQF